MYVIIYVHFDEIENIEKVTSEVCVCSRTCSNLTSASIIDKRSSMKHLSLYASYMMVINSNEIPIERNVLRKYRCRFSAGYNL